MLASLSELKTNTITGDCSVNRDDIVDRSLALGLDSKDSCFHSFFGKFKTNNVLLVDVGHGIFWPTGMNRNVVVIQPLRCGDNLPHIPKYLLPHTQHIGHVPDLQIDCLTYRKFHHTHMLTPIGIRVKCSGIVTVVLEQR